MSIFGFSIWNVLWVLIILGVGTGGWVMVTAWRKRQWLHFFDAKRNTGFPSDGGNFNGRWKRYEGLARLCITLSAGAVAFLVNLLVKPNSPPHWDRRKCAVRKVPSDRLFGSGNHDTYLARKYVLSQALGSTGFVAFLLGVLCLGCFVAVPVVKAQGAPTSVKSSSDAPLKANSELGMQSSTSALDWLSSERSLALATWGLVIATLLLVLDGYRKSGEQEKQWKREQKEREEEAKPSAVIEIVVKEEAPLDMCFACFNLGSNTFYIDRMIVVASDGRRCESDLTPQVLPPGTWVTIDYDPAQLLGLHGEPAPLKEANCVFILKGATGTVETDPVWFCLGYGSGRAAWSKGRLADRLPGTIPSQPKVLRMQKQGGGTPVDQAMDA